MTGRRKIPLKIESFKPEPETCGSCKFFVGNKEDNLGYCRRYPPTPLVTDYEQLDVSYVQPVVEAQEYCGEYKRHLDS